MLREFKFPDVGEGIAEGEIVHWLVKEGDWIEEDQDLVQVETDKAVITLHSPFTGKIEKLYGKEGEVIKVGALLTTVQDGGEAAPAPPSRRRPIPARWSDHWAKKKKLKSFVPF